MGLLSKQQSKVFNILNRPQGATAREIIEVTNYPSSLIRDLKSKGVKIDSEPIPDKNYIRYFLVKDEQPESNLNAL